MIARDRFGALAAILIALAALLLLASGLGGLELREAQSFAPPQRQGTPHADQAPLKPIYPEGTPLSPAFGSLLMLLAAVSLIFFLVSPEFRKLVLKRVSWLLWLMLTLVLLVFAMRGRIWPEQREEEAAGGGGRGMEFAGEFPFEPALWISILLTFLLSLLVIHLFWKAYQKEKSGESLDRLGASAAAALADLRRGLDSRSAVLRCYAEMQKTVRQQRGLERKASMTPREFEEALQISGLPPAPVRELTRLFEAARYGTGQPTPLENERAAACLEEIASFALRPAQDRWSEPSRRPGEIGRAAQKGSHE